VATLLAGLVVAFMLRRNRDISADRVEPDWEPVETPEAAPAA
jgi:hypothetical protein